MNEVHTFANACWCQSSVNKNKPMRPYMTYFHCLSLQSDQCQSIAVIAVSSAVIRESKYQCRRLKYLTSTKFRSVF